MKQAVKIAFYSFVKTFYRENAGLFVFLFTIMFGVVNTVDGAGLFQYHYSLILGMLKSTVFLLLVFFAWFLYIRKCLAFATAIIRNPEYTFLTILNCLDKPKRIRLFLFIVFSLLLPVLIYGSFIIAVGLQLHFYLPVVCVIICLLLMWLAPALSLVKILEDPYKKSFVFVQKINLWSALKVSYPLILLRFVAGRQKMVWLGIKVFTCGVVYLIARNNTASDYDTSFPFLFFNFGVLANALIIYRVREFEETQLSFHRGLPVTLFRRLLQYAIVYFILLIPEYVVLFLLAPVHLHYTDAVFFMLSCYSLLMLMSSITFFYHMRMKEFLKILLIIFCLQLFFLLTAGLGFLSLLFFLSSIFLFTGGYYRFERNVTS